MAKKKNKKIEIKSKKQRRREQYILFMILLVAFTMLFSTFYFFTSPTERIPGRGEGGERPYFQSYDARHIGNMSILVKTEEIKPDLIAISHKSCTNFQTIDWVYNISISGLKDVVCEVANPKTSSYYDICGDFLFFKFIFENIDENTTEKLKNELDNRLDEYTLKRAYIGILPLNLSGPGTDTDKVYVPGDLETKKGDYAKIFLFQKSSDKSLIGLEKNTIPVGPVVSAKVINITDIIVQGAIVSDFYPNSIQDDINVITTSIYSPKILINNTIDNKTIEDISKLTGVNLEIKGNRTEILFNSSLKDIMEILDREKLEYSIEKGFVLLKIPLNSSFEQVKKVLEENSIADIEFNKNGLVKVPNEIMINDNLVTIRDYDKFAVLLNIKTNVSDMINITISTIQIGDQVFVIGGFEAN